jgi:hypothetical protein
MWAAWQTSSKPPCMGQASIVDARHYSLRPVYLLTVRRHASCSDGVLCTAERYKWTSRAAPRRVRTMCVKGSGRRAVRMNSVPKYASRPAV